MTEKDSQNNPHWSNEFSNMKRVQSDRIVYNDNKSIPLRSDHDHNLSNLDSSVENIPLDLSLPVSGQDFLTFAQACVAKKKLRQLKQGKLSPQYTLDLHQQTRAGCLELVSEAINACQRQYIPVLHIIHGKSITNDTAIIKSFLNETLRENKNILAFTSAPSNLGGTGALLCLIKTNQEPTS